MTTIRLRQHGMLKWLFAGSLALITLLCTMMIVERASAHGYVQSPGSRAYLCKTGANTNCGPIVYEPQSLEAPKGFPAAGPADGKIASANGAFPTLDEQSSTRWSKVNLTPGTNTFSWTLDGQTRHDQLEILHHEAELEPQCAAHKRFLRSDPVLFGKL